MAAKTAQWRSWDKRAQTILGKAQALMCDMLEALGEDDNATDFADSVCETAENLANLCERQVAAKGTLK